MGRRSFELEHSASCIPGSLSRLFPKKLISLSTFSPAPLTFPVSQARQSADKLASHNLLSQSLWRWFLLSLVQGVWWQRLSGSRASHKLCELCCQFLFESAFIHSLISFRIGLTSCSNARPAASHWQNYLVITTKKELCPWTLAQEFGFWLTPSSWAALRPKATVKREWQGISSLLSVSGKDTGLEIVSFSFSQVWFAFSCPWGVGIERPHCRSLKL